MKKRIHYKNFNPKCRKFDLNQIWFKMENNPRRFDNTLFKLYKERYGVANETTGKTPQ